VVLESAEAKEKEREWLKNQLSGDLDDAKIVDGASGENRIYRKRGKPDTKLGLTQKLPKRIVFAIDISASMSRMNNWDGRLDRMASAVIMLMETLSDPNITHKFEYCLMGHSGVAHEFMLVDFGQVCNRGGTPCQGCVTSSADRKRNMPSYFGSPSHTRLYICTRLFGFLLAVIHLCNTHAFVFLNPGPH
jgi:hypothetical protein